MNIVFPGGLAVEARFDDFTVRTDQPLSAGGKNSAPAPFDLFLASLGTCAGFFALRFCQERQLPTRGLKLSLESERNGQSRRLDTIRISVELPADFPEKYQKAILRAIDQCSVKKALFDPPAFEVRTTRKGGSV